jgi:hypothetical protein
MQLKFLKASFLFFSFVLFFSTNTFAQSKIPESALVKLNNDSIILGDTVSYNSRTFKADLITLDNRTFKARNVKLYKNQGGYLYARIDGDFRTPTYYYKRLNFYAIVGQTTTNSHGQTSGGGTTYYYCKDLNDVKKLTLNNIKKDFTGGKQTKALINKAIEYRSLASTFALISVATFLVNSSFMFSSNPPIPKKTVAQLEAVSLIATVGLSIHFNRRKKKTIMAAVKTYSGYQIPYY